MSSFVSQLPQGWTTRQTRFMWALVDPDGVDRSFGLTEEAVAAAVWTRRSSGEKCSHGETLVVTSCETGPTGPFFIALCCAC